MSAQVLHLTDNTLEARIQTAQTASKALAMISPRRRMVILGVASGKSRKQVAAETGYTLAGIKRIIESPVSQRVMDFVVQDALQEARDHAATNFPAIIGRIVSLCLDEDTKPGATVALFRELRNFHAESQSGSDGEKRTLFDEIQDAVKKHAGSRG